MSDTEMDVDNRPEGEEEEEEEEDLPLLPPDPREAEPKMKVSFTFFLFLFLSFLPSFPFLLFFAVFFLSHLLSSSSRSSLPQKRVVLLMKLGVKAIPWEMLFDGV